MARLDLFGCIMSRTTKMAKKITNMFGRFLRTGDASQIRDLLISQSELIIENE